MPGPHTTNLSQLAIQNAQDAANKATSELDSHLSNIAPSLGVKTELINLKTLEQFKLSTNQGTSGEHAQRINDILPDPEQFPTTNKHPEIPVILINLNAISKINTAGEIKTANVNSEISAEFDKYEKLKQDIFKILEPSYKLATRANDIIVDSEKLTASLLKSLKDEKLDPDLVDKLEQFADKLEEYAKLTNSKELIKAVKLARELTVKGGDISDKETKQLVESLYGELSTVDTQVVIAQREVAKHNISNAAQEMRNFIEQEACADSLRGEKDNPGFIDSQQFKDIKSRINEINLI